MKVGLGGYSLKKNVTRKQSFASESSVSANQGTYSMGQPSFQVNKTLEYASPVLGLSIFPLIGAVLGGSLGLKKDELKEKIHEFPKSASEGFFKEASSLKKGAIIGGAIGGAVGLILLPFALNGARERVYKKQLQYDVMSSIDTKAHKNELTASEASDYLKASALQTMASNPPSNSGNGGMVAAAYLVGSHSSSSASSKKS